MNDRVLYRVKSGDYLGKIANKYGVSVNNLKRWNNLRSTRLRIGQRIYVYPKRLNETPKKTVAAKKTSTPTGEFSTYIVRKGDSLWLISRKYENVSVKNIKEWNNIWGDKKLQPGTKLKIYNTI